MELQRLFNCVNFPIRPTTLDHRHGGKITEIHGISHREDRPKGGYSRDYWFFVADVEWRDGSKSTRTEVEPIKVCCEDPGNNDELKCAMRAMDEYLREHGEYHDGRPHQGWYAHRKVKAAAA
jgi:hypothetical protein